MLAESLRQAWPPFVLVAGLLMIGAVAFREGLFAWAGSVLERLPGSGRTLFVACCLTVVVVTAILNLDTAVVFLTPVLILAARRRGLAETPFVYAPVFMANASSLFLPGSNLTNLLVTHGTGLSGSRFAREFAPAATVAAASTILVLVIIHRRALAAPAAGTGTEARPLRWGPGVITALIAGVLTVVLPQPALPILGLGCVAVLWSRARGGIALREVVDAVAPLTLGGVFAFAVALGVLARAWHAPAHLVAGASVPTSALLGAVTAPLLNNLPAAVMLSSGPIPHPVGLLIGLNLGPSLAVTGSLSAFLWLKSARQVDAAPSLRRFSRDGAVIVPVTIALTVLAALA